MTDNSIYSLYIQWIILIRLSQIQYTIPTFRKFLGVTESFLLQLIGSFSFGTKGFEPSSWILSLRMN